MTKTRSVCNKKANLKRTETHYVDAGNDDDDEPHNMTSLTAYAVRVCGCAHGETPDIDSEERVRYHSSEKGRVFASSLVRFKFFPEKSRANILDLSRSATFQ